VTTVTKLNSGANPRLNKESTEMYPAAESRGPLRVPHHGAVALAMSSAPVAGCTSAVKVDQQAGRRSQRELPAGRRAMVVADTQPPIPGAILVQDAANLFRACRAAHRPGRGVCRDGRGRRTAWRCGGATSVLKPATRQPPAASCPSSIDRRNEMRRSYGYR
jgi:hypothetical protein